jgi:hypothetical protein
MGMGVPGRRRRGETKDLWKWITFRREITSDQSTEEVKLADKAEEPARNSGTLEKT